MKATFTVLLITLIITSCNQPGCRDNENEILNSKDKNSWVYQQELMRLIDENSSDVKYYFERRAAINGESFIIMNCYGPDFCGELKTKFVPKNVASIRLQNKGSRGAQLMGVEFRKIKLENGHEIYAFEKLERIID